MFCKKTEFLFIGVQNNFISKKNMILSKMKCLQNCTFSKTDIVSFTLTGNSPLPQGQTVFFIRKTLTGVLIGGSHVVKKFPQGNPLGIKSKTFFFSFCFSSEKKFFLPFIFKNLKMKRITLSHSRENVPGASRQPKP